MSTTQFRAMTTGASRMDDGESNHGDDATRVLDALRGHGSA